MAIDQRLNQYQELLRQLETVRDEARAISSGGGGDGVDMMDRRVSRLESNYDGLSNRLGQVEIQLATLNERVAHLPSKGFIVTSLATSVAIISGVAVVAQRLGFFQ